MAWKDRLLWAFGMLFFLVMGRSAIWALYYSWGWKSYNDSAIFNYIAWRIGEGAVPYRDIFDMNFPGIYVVHLLLQKVLGHSDLAFRLYDAGFAVATGIAMALFCGRRWLIFALGAGCYFFCVHVSHAGIAQLQRDYVIVPFLLFASVLLRDWLEDFSKGRMGIAGALLGIAFCIKPPAAAMAGMAGITLLLWPVAWERRFRACLQLTAGFAVPVALMHGWLWYAGGLGAFYEILLQFTLPVYSGLPAFSRPHPWRSDVGSLRVILTAAVLCFGTSGSRASKCCLLMGLVYSEIHLYSQHKFFYYHRYPIYAYLALCWAWTLPRLTLRWWHMVIIYTLVWLQCWHYTPKFLLSPKSIAYAQRTVWGISPAYQQEVAEDARQALESVPQYIRDDYTLLRPGKDIQVFDFVQSELWNVAYRERWALPLRHIYTFPFYILDRSHYMLGMREELVSALYEVKPPVLIIGGDSYPLAFGMTWQKIDGKGVWMKLFSSHYRLTAAKRGYRVYARKL